MQDNKGRLYIEVLQYGVLIVSCRYTDMKKIVSYQCILYYSYLLIAVMLLIVEGSPKVQVNY